MKDSDLRAIVLREFYANRRQVGRYWDESDAPNGISPEDFFSICLQLAEHGLIECEPHYKTELGTPKVKLVMGQITAHGVDVVEGNARPPISISFDQRKTVSISGSHNIVGDNNCIDVDEISLAISNSSSTEAEKAEAKSLWKKVSENKLLNSVLSSAAGAATKHALEAIK